jgi:hypothetical protein
MRPDREGSGDGWHEVEGGRELWSAMVISGEAPSSPSRPRAAARRGYGFAPRQPAFLLHTAMFYVIGLGLCDEKDITVRGLEVRNPIFIHSSEK